MRLPLLLDKKPTLNFVGPEVLLGKGTWRFESNTNLFVVRYKPLGSKPDDNPMTLGPEFLTLHEYATVQVLLTGADKDKVSIFAVKQ